MPISFGSVGDIISVSLLIKDLVRCLDESRGSSTEYQAVIRELWSLDNALLQVELLLRSYKHSVELSDLWENANCCVEQCRKCISDYQSKTKKYQRALQGRGTGNLFRDTTAKIRWHVSEKDDLTKFRTEITTLGSSLNMLLTTAGIKLSSFSDEGIRERLKQSDLAHASSSALQTSFLVDLMSRLEENNSLIRESTSAINALGSRFDLYEKDFRIFGAELMSFIHKIWRFSSLTYNALISLQARIPVQLDRTWTQEPAMLEDALGRIWPFHLECIDSWEAFEAILEVHFRHLPGHRKIKRKEYALTSDLFDKDVDSTIPFSHCFLPGRRYDMSMVFDTTRAHTSCPACFYEMGTAADSRVKCNGCGLWYQRIAETAAPPGKTAVPSEFPCLKRQREADSEDDDDEPRQFRRVRIRCRQRARRAQGDAVLIRFMEGLNYPDLATKVGDVPLPQFDDSDVDDPMDVEGKDQTNGKKAVSDKNIALIQIAEDALPFMSNEARQQALQAAAGISNAATAAANAKTGFQVPSSMQQQAPMMANGGGGLMLAGFEPVG